MSVGKQRIRSDEETYAVRLDGRDQEADIRASIAVRRI